MKYLKMFGLAALAAALMAFAAVGTASAATLEDAGGVMEVGDKISAESSHTVLHPPFGSITCAQSSVSGTITNAHGVSGSVDSLSFSSCNATVTVLKKGTLSIDGNGVLTGSGQEVTVNYLGTHCIFSTNSTKLGTVTSSSKTKGHAVLDIEATIPRTGGGSGAFCGSTAQWTGNYTVTNPATLNVLK
jgi:hypothetical protein